MSEHTNAAGPVGGCYYCMVDGRLNCHLHGARQAKGLASPELRGPAPIVAPDPPRLTFRQALIVAAVQGRAVSLAAPTDWIAAQALEIADAVLKAEEGQK